MQAAHSHRDPAQLTRLAEVGDLAIDWRFKGFIGDDDTVTVASVGARGWNALGGDLLFPIVVLRRNALEHNIALMAQYCSAHGVSFAPHAKTPIAPQIVQRQLQAGAWGITAATVHQCRVLRHFGVSRLLLANQLLEKPALRWVAQELDREPGFDFMCLVDSLDGVAIMDELLSQLGPRRRLEVLVEVGVRGGRAGARSSADAIAVASAVAGSRCLALAGVEGYEGILSADRSPQGLRTVDDFVEELREVTREMHGLGVFGSTAEVLVSAGGSVFPDRVVQGLAGGSWGLDRPVRVLLRSGSYITHADGSFDELAALGSGHHVMAGDALQQAFEAWGMVLSRPEPELAIIGFGKRDVPYDSGLPIAFELRRRSGAGMPLAQDVAILSLNDQHARVRVPADLDFGPGDLVGFHITHPCTTFDKWRLIPVVDDDYVVVDAIATYF